MSQILLLGKESWGQSKSTKGILVYIWMSICRGWDKEGDRFLFFSHYPHKQCMCFPGSRALKMGGVRDGNSIHNLSKVGTLTAKQRDCP